MAKYSYTVTVNAVPEAGRTIEYKYRSTPCVLTCSKGAVQLRFEMGVKKKISQPAFFSEDLVKDAMRKMYLMHAMVFDGRLWIDTITVTRGDEAAVYDKETSQFPFLFSMLTSSELKLPDSWRDDAFLTEVLTRPKSAADDDARFACLFSFLAGAGKRYEIEKFTCYWTAMNAHYNYLYSCYRAERARRGKNADRSSDSACIGALMRVLGCGEKLSNQRERNEIYKGLYGAMKVCLQNYSMEELEQLYIELYEVRRSPGFVPDRGTVMREDLRTQLEKCLSRDGTCKPTLSAWGFLLLDYAYHMRCKYFHGNKATILFTGFNDREIAAFRCLNVFLGNYLRQAIPEMFREDWFTQDMFDAVNAGK